MVTKTTTTLAKLFTTTVLFLFGSSFLLAQETHNHEGHAHEANSVYQERLNVDKTDFVSNPFGISEKEWFQYSDKTFKMLEKVDVASFINYVIFSSDGNMYDKDVFLSYKKNEFKEDRLNLILKVGKGEITEANIREYLSSLQPKYKEYFKEFKSRRDEIVEQTYRQQQGAPAPTPFACGQPCTNPGFESGNGFWNYWSATACASSSSDPCSLVSGFNSAGQHQIMTAGGFDPTVGGTTLPVVPPGGGNNSLLLGDYTTGAYASRASISFTVSAASANFTYRYAVVLEDPVSGHTDPERPYFSVKIRDASGNVVTCGDYYVSAKPPIANFTQVGSTSYYYRPWTTVFVPLSSYMGQCVTVEFTSSDCSQGGHLGYAYIDGDCDPIDIIASSPAVCGGNSVILTAPAGGVSYAWTNTAGGTTGIVGPTNGSTATVNQGGTYQVVITSVAGPTCTTTLNITVGSNPSNPVASFTNTTVCAGAATTFTDTSTPVGSITAWSWDFNNDGTPDSNVQNPSYTFPAAGTYPVTLIITWGPCNATVTQNVTVNAGTAPTITPAGPFCSYAAAVNLTSSVGGGTWSGTGITNAATGTFTPSSATIGNNTITYSVGGACPATVNSTIVVDAPPISDAGPDITICSATSGTIGSANNVLYSYSWSPGTGLSATNISAPTVTLTNVGAAPITSTYTVTTTVIATGCISTDAVDVTVNPVATANAGPAQTICAGTTATLAGAIGGAATSGTWSGGAGTYAPNATTLNAVYTPSAAEVSAGTVTLTLSTDDPAGPCPLVTSNMTITINPIAVIDAGADQTTCVGGTITLAGILGGSSTIGTWTGGTGTYNPNNTTANAIYTPSAAEEAAGTVTLTYTSDDPAGPCSAVSDQMIITINQLPTVNAGLDQTICAGSTAPLSGVIGGAATMATWSGGTGTFAPNNTTLNAVYTPSAAEVAAGTVTLTLTTDDPAGPCVSVNDQMVININTPATINAGLDQTICIGSTVTLAGVIGGSATTGTWTGGAGAFAPNNTTANAIYTPTAAEATAGTVTLTYTSDDPIGPCPSVNDQMVITINPLPTVNAGVTQTVCVGTSITLGGSVGGAATSGTWSGGNGTYVPNANALNAVYTPSAAEYAAGTVTLTLTTNDPAGPCNAVSTTVTHNFYQNPVINISVDDPDGCPVHCVNFTDNSTVAGVGASIVSWVWNFGDGSPTDVTQNPAHCYTNTGYYDVSLTATSNQGCTSTSTVLQMIFVFPVPNAEFTPNPNPASVLDPVVTLVNQSSSDVTSWYYYFGDGDSIAPFVSSPTHTYPNTVAQTYNAMLYVVNGYGCWDTVIHPVMIGPEYTFYIPNAFTPNGDGINDYFFGQGIGIVDYDLWIFDRWGNMIFHGDELSSKWDGRANHGSDVAQQDVYVWKVKLTDVFGKKHNFIGTVTLVK